MEIASTSKNFTKNFPSESQSFSQRFITDYLSMELLDEKIEQQNVGRKRSNVIRLNKY